MKLTFENLNPNNLHDELIKAGIIPILAESSPRKDDEYIAKNVWMTFEDDIDIAKVNEVVAKHNPIQLERPTADEILRAKLIKDNASMQLQLAQQQKLNADILLKLASLGGSTNV